MNEISSFIKDNDIGKFKEDVELSDLTTYKVGGAANFVVYPKNVLKLIVLIKKLREIGIKYKVLGFGSNVIFSDKKYDGVIIKLDEFNEVIFDDTTLTAGAGTSLIKLSHKAQRLGLSGLEFAAGIPGSIGGAVFMNAGAYKSDMSDVVSEVKVLTPELEIKILSNKDLHYGYRESFLKENPDYICLEAKLNLKKGNKEEIKDLMQNRKQRRTLSQPLEYPSAGSVFRNPEGEFAGHLIEECGLKGYKIGGAQVSEKHANFIINKDKATATDVRNLILFVQEKVKQKYKINLKVEQEFVNWE